MSEYQNRKSILTETLNILLALDDPPHGIMMELSERGNGGTDRNAVRGFRVWRRKD
jgi:hypothetical protein